MGRQKKKGGKAGKVQSKHCTTCAVSDSRHPPHTRTKQKEKEVVELKDSDDEPLDQPKKKRRKLARYNRSTLPRIPCQIADIHITRAPNRKRRKRWVAMTKVHVTHVRTQTQSHMTARTQKGRKAGNQRSASQQRKGMWWCCRTRTATKVCNVCVYGVQRRTRGQMRNGCPARSLENARR